MRRAILLAVGLLSVGAAGCATAINSAVPLGNGQVLAVGAKAAFLQGQTGAAWLCPAQPKAGDCKEITVKEVEK
jgi:hypothetical protein